MENQRLCYQCKKPLGNGNFCPHCGFNNSNIPAEAEKINQEIQIIEPVQPVQVVQPVQSVQPVQVVQPVQSVQPVQVVQPVQSVQPQQVINGGSVQEKRKKKKGGKIALVFFLILLLVIGGGGATYLLMPTIPDVTGELEDDAIDMLKDEGFGKGDYEIEYEYDKRKEKGIVIEQSPEGDTKTFKKDLVLIVSMGPEEFELEGVIGLSQEEATKVLEDGNLKVVVEEVYSNESLGNVIGMMPEAGETVKGEDEITLTVSLGPDPNAITFTDDAFKLAIVEYLGLDVDVATQPITKDMVKDVTTLDVSGKGIKNVDGIEAFEALVTLEMYSNDIESLDLSKNLKLTSLRAFECKLTEFPKLPMDITFVDVADNKIKDISSIKNYPNLTTVFLDNNLIEDFSVFDTMDMSLLTASTSGNIGTYGNVILPTINDVSSIQSTYEINNNIESVFPDDHELYSSFIGLSAAGLADILTGITLEEREADDPLNIDEYYYSEDDVSAFFEVDNTLDVCINATIFYEADIPMFEGNVVMSTTENNTLLDATNILGMPSEFYIGEVFTFMTYYTTEMVYTLVYEDNLLSFLMIYSNDDYFY